MNKKPHKHAELIKAWADGAEIEVLVGHKWVGVEENWTSYQNPFWYPDMEYRIKPEPKPDVVVYGHFAPSYLSKRFDSVYHNLQLTFDGETGKLKSAEVLK